MTVNVFNMTDTWNDGGTVFTGLKLNVTNTASAAGSKAFDFQIGSNSVFDFDVTAGILSQRNATNAQTFRVYNTFTDASNYERGVFDWTTNANVLTIGTEKGGSGTLRNVFLDGASTIIGGADGPVLLCATPAGGTAAVYIRGNGSAQSISNHRDGQFGWSSNIDASAAGPDTGLNRVSAGVVEVNNGTPGTLGSLKLDAATGSGTTTFAATNCPATTLTAPYTWIKVISSDGSLVYMPAWK